MSILIQQHKPNKFLIWMAQSFVYFHKCPSAGKFCKEYNFIRREIGLLNKYIDTSLLEDNGISKQEI